MFNFPKTLTLNYKKWRCGSSANRRNKDHGAGITALLNEDGYQCCLGQWCEQAGVPKNDLLDVGAPDDLPKELWVKQPTSNFFEDAVAINDSDETIRKKIAKLKSLMRQQGRKLRVINLPERFKD